MLHSFSITPRWSKMYCICWNLSIPFQSFPTLEQSWTQSRTQSWRVKRKYEKDWQSMMKLCSCNRGATGRKPLHQLAVIDWLPIPPLTRSGRATIQCNTLQDIFIMESMGYWLTNTFPFLSLACCPGQNASEAPVSKRPIVRALLKLISSETRAQSTRDIKVCVY